MTVATRACIDAVALGHNLARVRHYAPSSRVLAVVKSDAYGHGLVETARALDAADGFAVARVPEGVTLRESGVRHRVVVLSGFHDRDELDGAIACSLDSVIHVPEQIDMLDGVNAQGAMDVWLKVDTGMHRIGFAPRDLPAAVDRLRRLRCVRRLHMMSHLANADDTDDERSALQINAFTSLQIDDSVERSLANSAGVVAWPSAHGDWIRPGIMLYGVSPLVGRSAASMGLRPVMTLRSRLIAVRDIEAGATVGYGGTWRAPTPTRLGIVACGYGDGYPRHAASGTPVRVGERIVALIGRVSMDMLAVDLSAHPHARFGDDVVLWGEGLPVENVAESAGTIGYQLLCAVTARVPRVWHQ